MRFLMDREYCFVLMPFAREYRSLYMNAILPAVNDVHLDCIRADESPATGSIMKDVICGIFNAKAVIAVLDTLNANVMYELGVAHALGRPTISLINEATNIPFDMAAYRVVKYKNEENLRQTFQASLSRTLQGKVDDLSNPVVDSLPIKLPSLIATVTDIQDIEAKATGEVWIIGPDCAIDISLYADVMRKNICEKGIKYKYILAKSAKPSWQALIDHLNVPRQYASNLSAKFVKGDSIESDLVVYNPHATQQLKVYLKPALASSNSFYICLDTARGFAIRERFNRLWHRRILAIL